MLTEENMPFEEESEPAPSMLSKIQDHASYQFRYLKGDRRNEVIHEVVCNCYVAYARLVEQG